jgi:hypothetical protein
MPPLTTIICFTQNILDDIDSNNIDKCVHDPMVVKDFKCQNDSFWLASCNVEPKSLDLNKLSTYVVSFSMLVVGDWETINTPCWMWEILLKPQIEVMGWVDFRAFSPTRVKWHMHIILDNYNLQIVQNLI